MTIHTYVGVFTRVDRVKLNTTYVYGYVVNSYLISAVSAYKSDMMIV